MQIYKLVFKMQIYTRKALIIRPKNRPRTKQAPKQTNKQSDTAWNTKSKINVFSGYQTYYQAS